MTHFKLAPVAACITALSALVAGTAQAQSFTPSTGTLPVAGQVKATTVIARTCNMIAIGNMTASSISLSSITLFNGDIGCSSMSPSGPWTAAPVAGSTNLIDLTISLGICSGTIRANWDNSSHLASFSQFLGPCHLEGVISIPPLNIV